jgi:hypothetical protein
VEKVNSNLKTTYLMKLVSVEYFVSDSMDYLNLMTQKEVAEGVWLGIMRGVAKVQLTRRMISDIN